MSKRFWFYNDWFEDDNDEVRSWYNPARWGFSKGADEYGHHTVVIPLGKGRVLCVVYWSGYKGILGYKKCQGCIDGRKQTLDFEQEIYYVQTYWNIAHLDDVHELDMDDWDKALGA